jgi:hypothetical protein
MERNYRIEDITHNMITTERISENRKIFGFANARRVWQPLQQAFIENTTG